MRTLDIMTVNPQGLNDILLDVLGYEVSGDWDKDMPNVTQLGSIPKADVPKVIDGKVGNEWGRQTHYYAVRYLKNELEKNGWTVSVLKEFNGFEYDLIGWEKETQPVPDLHVELYFPQPKEFPFKRDLAEKVIKKPYQAQENKCKK
jgi:hypothetical protein